MPTVTLNKDVFEELVGKKLPADELKDRISMLGTDLEGIEGNEIHVEVFPNRPDMLSEQGFARAFSSFIGHKTGLRQYDVQSSKEKVIVEEAVSDVRPYTVCAIVRGLSFDDERIREVIQIQEKLHVTQCRKRKKGAIGIYPLEAITFPVRFTALPPKEITFQPLESDREMDGLQVLSAHPTGRDYAHLLEGLEKFPVFIDANDEVLSMPPVINSHKTGRITPTTTDVFVECSGFDMKTLSHVLNIIVTALADMGGKIESIEVEYPDQKLVTPDLSPARMKFDLAYVNKRLGLTLSEEEAVTLLGKMGFGYEAGEVLIPAYRADILHQIDFAEDIAIAYGYENFQEELCSTATVGKEDLFERFKNIVADVLVGQGLLEVNTFHITDRELQTERMRMPDLVPIALKNSLSADFDTMRAWLLPSMLHVFQNNKHNEYPQSIFGFGSAFVADESTESGIGEQPRLCVAHCDEAADYTYARQMLDSVFGALALDYGVEAVEHPSYIPGRVGKIVVEGTDVGFIGELHPEVLDNFKLDYPVCALEVELRKIFDKKNKI
ncbi:phenylalanine--tRNA ligase subunit beta [Candidatus Woesearchaeota archaeon]|nr:phenylalanine--tRNA ligase subunit beta [Candidatus Woesearchaeota archaeon]